MRFIPRGKIVFLIVICRLVSVCAALTPEDQAAYDVLQKMDLSRQDMSGVKALYDAGRYVDALDAWRDYVMADLRATPMGEFKWHSGKMVGYQTAFADVLIGAMTEAEYVDYLASVNREWVHDAWGLSGAPGTMTNANWLAVPPDSFSAGEMASYKAFIPLTAKYWQTQSSSYAAKWFEIASDFARNCYNDINSLPQAEKEANYPKLRWDTSASSALHQAWRVENIFKSLAVLAKSVPAGTKSSGWMESLDARPDTLAPGAYGMMPAQQLADIAVSLVEDHSIALLDRYLTDLAISNQRLSGLYGLLLTSHFLDMFQSVQTNIAQQGEAAMLDFVTTTVHPDGGRLEQSLNYNEGEAELMEELVDIYAGTTNVWSSPMEESVKSFWQMVWSLRGSTLSPPQIGNHSIDLATEVWADSSVRDSWIQSQLADYPAVGPLEQQINNAYSGSVSNLPAFTSVAFPYAGYYVQRSGWTIDDMSLFFMGGRPQRGHHMADKNAVQLSGFGRDLLVAAGPPNYGPSTAPTVADDYLSEGSSAKINAIMVDDQDQNRPGEAPHVFTSTIDALWHTSDHFDLVEGLHEQGYGAEMDVSHQRRSVFVKEAGLWVLLDNLFSNDVDSHTYRQTWNFQPYKIDSGTSVYGFKLNEVVVDAVSNRIYTADSDTVDTPNVHLYSFGESVTFEKYYGSSAPVYGWYARSIGDLIPAVDVHTVFSGTGDRQLLTLIKPVEGLPSGISSLTDRSSGVTNGFDCTTDSGVALSVRSTLDSGITLSAGGVTAQARALLVTTVNGTVRGMVLDAETFSSGTLNLLCPGGTSFEFEVVDSDDVIVMEMSAPQSFQWLEDGGVISPDYGDNIDKWVDPGLLYAQEVFDYPVGTALNTTASGNGWSTGWKADWALTAQLDAAVSNVVAGSLTSAAFSSRGLSATGNQFSRAGNALPSAMYRGMDRAIDWSSDSVTYFSTLVNWAANHSSAAARIKFMLGDNNTYFGLFANGTDIHKMRLSVRNTSAATVNGADLYDRNITYMLVAKIQTVTGGNDTISLSLFDPAEILPETEPVWDLTASTGRGSGSTSVFGYEHNLYQTAMCSMDELRIGRTWNDVTANMAETLSYASYALWMAGYSVGTATNMTDNPDGDALDNLAEFALGGDPSATDTGYGSVAQTVVDSSGTNWFTYVHARRVNAEDLGLSYQVEGSTNLTDWSTIGIPPACSDMLDAEFDAVTYHIPITDAPWLFLRLRIEFK